MKNILKGIGLALVLLISACVAIDNDLPGDENDLPGDENDLLRLTLDELAYYDGREGRPAYIAVQGNIYDVSESPQWPNGNHNGYQAGQDLTDFILNVSPHGLSTLDNVPLIGVLVDDHDEEEGE